MTGLNTSLTLQDFQNFVLLAGDVGYEFEKEYIETYGEPDEDDRDLLNETVGEKLESYFENEILPDLIEREYTEEQIEEIRGFF
ncbi:hypothetical protein A9Y76_07025 [Ralstonia insidiosa]|uniref:Uncharacterized protein n=1 Tax=Ralstonia insidiosa TaxID=190721 RepID=A0A191ZVQ0_9RALS|nr:MULTISPECIES: hypothetical protein [Burkholderiaceae]ANJ72230.1 hypothetical protein A9Y76_07025 [Ralstonia insidiosa]